MQGLTHLGVSRIALALALIAVVGVAGIAVFANSQLATERSTSGAVALAMSPELPLVAPGQTQNYTSIEVSSVAGANLSGTLVIRAFAPTGIHILLNSTSVSLANDPQSMPFRLKADPSASPGKYQVVIETNSASTNAANRTFTIQVVPDLVIIQGLAFRPQNVTISKGTSVSWINLDSNVGCCDPGNHNVVFQSGSNASSTILKRLDAWSYTFDSAGTFGYECTIHPFMKGQIKVTG